MRKIIILISCLFCLTEVKGQKHNIFDHINNDNVLFDVWWIKSKFSKGTLIGPTFWVRVHKVAEDSVLLSKMTTEDWIEGLNNPKTDWAANLLLYDLYKKHAFVYRQMDKEEWERNLRKDDVEYWTEKLKR